MEQYRYDGRSNNICSRLDTIQICSARLLICIMTKVVHPTVLNSNAVILTFKYYCFPCNTLSKCLSMLNKEKTQIFNIKSPSFPLISVCSLHSPLLKRTFTSLIDISSGCTQLSINMIYHNYSPNYLNLAFLLFESNKAKNIALELVS